MGLDLDGVREVLQLHCAEAGSQNAWARKHGISQQFVSEVARGTRPPSERILRALGLMKCVSYIYVPQPWHCRAQLTDDLCIAGLAKAVAARDVVAIDGWRDAIAWRAFDAHWRADEIYLSAHEGCPFDEGVAEASAAYARARTLRQIEGVEPLFQKLLDEAEREEAELRSYDDEDEEYDE